MGGYSKIKGIINGATTTTADDPKSPTDSSSDPSKSVETTQQHDRMSKEEDTNKEEGENGKEKLRRNFSTSSSRFLRLERQNSNSIVSTKALQGALRRAFSVRSSSSDKYSRIYSDRPVALESPFEEDHDDALDEEDGDAKARSDEKDVKENNKMKKSSKIIRACKRILGL